MSFKSFVIWMITTRVAPIFFSFPEFDAPAGEDSWIALLLSTIPVTLALGVVVALTRLAPGTPLSDMIQIGAGRFVGSVVNVFLAGYFLLEAAISLWELDEVLVTTVLVRSPSLAVSGIMVLVVIAAVRKGIEPIARTTVVLAGGGIFAVSFLSLLLLPEIRLDHLLPVLPIDGRAMLSSVIYHASLADLLLVVAFLLPYTMVRTSQLRFIYVTPLIANSIIAMAMLLVIAVLSFPVADSLNFEYLSLIRQASLGRFLERFDPLVLTGWIVLGYLRISAFLLCALIALASVFGLRDYRPLAIPLGIILLTLSLVVFDTFAARELYYSGGGLVLNLFVGYVLPLCLLLFFRTAKGRARQVAEETARPDRAGDIAGDGDAGDDLFAGAGPKREGLFSENVGSVGVQPD